MPSTILYRYCLLTVQQCQREQDSRCWNTIRFAKCTAAELASEISCSEERRRQSIRAPSRKADMAGDLTQECWKRPPEQPECSCNPTAVTILSLQGNAQLQPVLVGRGLAITITICRKELFGQSREDYFFMHLYPLERLCLRGVQLFL